MTEALFVELIEFLGARAYVTCNGEALQIANCVFDPSYIVTPAYSPLAFRI